MIRAVRSIVSLKWALLVGGMRGSRQNRVQLSISILLSSVFGLAAVVLLASLGRTSAISGDALVVVLATTTLVVGMFAATTGVEASLDPRQLAAEPLSTTQLALGMLASVVVGPPAILAALSGLGLFLGWRSPGIPSDVTLIAVIVIWWITLLLFSRTVANVIGAWATGRFRRLAQGGAVAAALLGWVVANTLVGSQDQWNPQGLHTISRIAALSPPGRLAYAVTATGGRAVVMSLAIGASWLPLLLWASIVSTRRLVVVPPAQADSATMRQGSAGLYGFFTTITDGWARRRGRQDGRQEDGSRRTAAVARRTLVTKVRTPRQSVNTVTALVVGGGVLVLGPLLDGGVGDPRSVMLGGMLQFAVLFDGNNSFGVDGPAIWAEVHSGADAGDLVRAKVMSSVVTIGPFALLIPLLLAVIGNAWQWLPAAWFLAIGAVTSAAGVAVVMASVAPVAMPLSANPLAAGDTGQGCLAGVMLGVGVISLMALTAPFVAAVYLVSAHSTIIATAIAALVPLGGISVMIAGIRLAERRLRGNEAALVDKVTPRL